MPKLKSSSNNRLVALVMAVLILCIAAASWFFLKPMVKGESDKQYRNITYTDALSTCQNYTYERYGKKLKRLTLDNHSSRWEQKVRQYQLFFKADLAGKKPTDPTIEALIACDVSGHSGKIRDYEVLEDKTLQTKAQRLDKGGMYGWP